jgi:hypothetical protein
VTLSRPLQVMVLVMCHTRELAFQISKEYERFSKYMPSVKVSLGVAAGHPQPLQPHQPWTQSWPSSIYQTWLLCCL